MAIVRIILGVLFGAAVVAAREIRAGNGPCLVGRHSWWYCETGTPGHVHRYCRRCGCQELA